MITIQDDLQNNVPLFSVRGRKLINSNFIKKQLSDEKIKEFKEEIQTNSTSLKDIEYLLHNKNYKEFLEKMMVNENNNYLPHDLIFQILPNEKLTNNQSIIKNLAIKERWYEVSKLLDSLKPNLIRKKSLKVYRESLEDIYSNFKHSIQKLSSYPSYLLSMEDKTSERAIQFEGLRDTIRHYLLSHDYSFESNKNLPIISSKMQEEILNLLPKELDNELIYSPSQFFLTKTILSSSNVNEKILDQLPVESFVFKTNNDFIHAWNFIIDSSNLRYLARKYPAFLWSPNIKIKKNKFNVNIPFVVYYAWNNPNNELSFELIELAFDSLGSASTGNAVLDTYNKQLSSNIAHFIIDRKPFDEPTEKQLNIIEKLSILTENPKDFIKKISDEWRFDFPIASEILKQLHHSIPIKPETEAEAEAKAKTEQQED